MAYIDYAVIAICFIIIIVLIYTAVRTSGLSNDIDDLDSKLSILDNMKMQNNIFYKDILRNDYLAKVNKLMDDIITQAADIYQIMQLSQSSTEYINQEEADRMEKYIYGTVKNNMTEYVRNAIESIYVINSEEDLDKVLNLRIKLYMINFLRQYNDVIE